jgi:hypothetical protein
MEAVKRERRREGEKERRIITPSQTRSRGEGEDTGRVGGVVLN